MAFNRENVEIPLSLFGGLDTELAPSDLPEGVSPANNDVAYLPGSVGTRGGLIKLYPTISGTPVPAVTYLKTLRLQNGNSINLILDSNGVLWTEDVTNNPGVLSQLATVTPGSYAKSATAFGKEYIAFSDGVNGTGAPLQFDGVNLDRVSQDGPGSAPTFEDYTEALSITSIAGNGVGISSATVSINSDNASGVVTATTTDNHGLKVGQIVQVVGTSRVQFNGSVQVTGTPSATTFTYTIDLPTVTVTNCVRNSNITEIASDVDHNLVVGDQVSVQGGQDGAMCGQWTVATVETNRLWTYNNPGTSNHPAPAGMTFVAVSLEDASGGNVFQSATATMSVPFENAQPGDSFVIAGSSSGGTFPYDNNVGNNPSTWTILSISGSNVTFSILGNGGLTSSNSNTTGGSAVVGGNSSQGQYQCVQFFITRTGAFTNPSPPAVLQSTGTTKFKVSNLAIGPDNVVGRGLAFTGSGGAAFFFLPNAVSVPNPVFGGFPVSVPSTQINNNTQTSVILNLNDNSLFAGQGIDIDGNDLFSQVPLAPCLGFFSYGSRIFAWGDDNAVQNLRNMGFGGGYQNLNVPTGWSVDTTGGSLIQGDYGFEWQITSDGTSACGQLSQPAYQDSFNVPILSPLLTYQFKVRVSAPSGALSGLIVADIYSAANGVLSTASVDVSTASVQGLFLSAVFDTPMPAVIPADAVLRIYADGIPAGGIINISECELIDSAHTQNLAVRSSYVNNPEAFDGSTGLLEPEEDPTVPQNLLALRGDIVIITRQGLYYSTQGIGEPDTWVINTITQATGSLGIFAADAGMTGSADSGEEWIAFASRTGLYLYYGGAPEKISQEIQPNWESINFKYKKTVWVKADTNNRLIMIGAPIGTAQTPSQILVLDHRELDTADQIARNGPIRISYTGKMISSDITRKWTVYTLSMNCAQELDRADGVTHVCIGCGNGLAFGVQPCTGNAYYIDSTKQFDDDYGVIQASYTTYFAVNHEQEQNLGLGAGRKLLKQVALSVSGTGTLTVQTFGDSLSNPWPPFSKIPLQLSPSQDIAFGTNTSAERVAVQLSALPKPGQPNCGFNVSKLIMTVVVHPGAQTVGSVV